jgi:hypothetical protein
VGDVPGQVAPEDDVHRAGDAHPALEGQAGVLGHEAATAIGADEVLRAHLELASR